MVAVTFAVVNAFFTSHVFRWRTAMNEYYTETGNKLRHVEGAVKVFRKIPCGLQPLLKTWC